MKRDIAPEAEADRLVRLCTEKGFTAAKWRIAAECGEDVDEWPGRTEEICPSSKKLELIAALSAKIWRKSPSLEGLKLWRKLRIRPDQCRCIPFRS
jgi:hypothetical protein